MPADTPAIVFVHGAWPDASGFGESIRALRDRGFAAIGFANPLRHLTGDAASSGRSTGHRSVSRKARRRPDCDEPARRRPQGP
jgi:hypothetical protein